MVRQAHHSVPTKTLPFGTARVIRALVPVLVPPISELDVNGIEDNIVRDVGRALFEFPLFFRWFFLLGVYLFECLPFLSGFGFVRFSDLSITNRTKYMIEWAESRILPKREFFKGVKGVIMITYFSDKRVWAYLEYEPAKHVEERIKLREEILNRQTANP